MGTEAAGAQRQPRRRHVLRQRPTGLHCRAQKPEGQLKGWVERLLGEMQQQDIAIARANSRADLQRLLDADFRGLIITMIHSFEEIRKESSQRDNIYVFIDEAHRSVARELGTYL